MRDIFISYSRYDSDVVNELVTLMEQEGYSIWIDRDGIESGDDFKRVILKAIKESKVVLFFSSEHSNSSDWTAKEVGVAVKYKKHIVPVLLDDSNFNEAVEFDLINLDYVDYSKTSTRLEMRRKLFRALRSKIDRDEQERERLDAERKAKEKMREKVSVEESPKGLVFTVNGVSFNMVFVEGGTFQMGNYHADAFDNEKPVHEVTLNSYYVGETVVTQALWKAVMENNPSQKKGDNLPVESVSWEDCQKFIGKLHRLTGKGFRLPTEAEWEYAARGGKKTYGNNGYGWNKYAGAYGNDRVSLVQVWVDNGYITAEQAKYHPRKKEFLNGLSDVAWYNGNSLDETQEVKSKLPNELGLYDMSGNVWEWCEDWYGYYSGDSQFNPKGPVSGKYHVFRGGSVHGSNRLCQVSCRDGELPDFIGYYFGFRLALS